MKSQRERNRLLITIMTSAEAQASIGTLRRHGLLYWQSLAIEADHWSLNDEARELVRTTTYDTLIKVADGDYSPLEPSGY